MGDARVRRTLAGSLRSLELHRWQCRRARNQRRRYIHRRRWIGGGRVRPVARVRVRGSGGSAHAGASNAGASNAGASNAGASNAGASNAGTSNGGAEWGRVCTADSDCVVCVYPSAPRKTADCYCATCTGEQLPLSETSCDANHAAWQAVCSAVPMDCNANECASPKPVCKAGMCAWRSAGSP